MKTMKLFLILSGIMIGIIMGLMIGEIQHQQFKKETKAIQEQTERKIKDAAEVISRANQHFDDIRAALPQLLMQTHKVGWNQSFKRWTGRNFFRDMREHETFKADSLEVRQIVKSIFK